MEWSWTKQNKWRYAFVRDKQSEHSISSIRCLALYGADWLTVFLSRSRCNHRLIGCIAYDLAVTVRNRHPARLGAYEENPTDHFPCRAKVFMLMNLVV
jgi:hypothetical protein